jgi:hypothetical protein
MRNRLVDLLGTTGGRPEPQPAERYLPAALVDSCCRAAAKKQRLNSSLLREMWRTAASLELLPYRHQGRTGRRAGAARIKAGDFRESELWCLSRLGARQFVLRARSTRSCRRPRPGAGPKRCSLSTFPASATPWPPSRAAPKIPRATWPHAPLSAVRRKLESLPHADRYLAVLDGDEERDDRALGRIFGEELPSGLVLAD